MALGRNSLATSLLSAAALWCLVLACLHRTLFHLPKKKKKMAKMQWMNIFFGDGQTERPTGSW